MSKPTNHDILQEMVTNFIEDITGLLEASEKQELETAIRDDISMMVEREATKDELFSYRNKEYKGYVWRDK